MPSERPVAERGRMPESQMALVRAMGPGRHHSSKHPLGQIMYYVGLSTPKLALQTGLSYKTIQNAVTSWKLLSLVTARRVADALGVRVYDILPEKEAVELRVVLPDDAWVRVAPAWPVDPHTKALRDAIIVAG